MHVVVVALSGRELASLEADSTWGRREICARIPGLQGSLARSARLVCGLAVLTGDNTLGDLGVDVATTVTLVLDAHHAFVVLAGSDDHTAKLWSVESGEEVLTLTGHDDHVTGVAMTPDGDVFVTVADNGIAMVWDGGTGVRSLSVRVADDLSGIDGVAISRCRTHFATASMAESAVSLWKLVSGERVREWHHEEARRVGFSPTGRFVMSVAFDGVLKLWDIFSCDCLRTLDERRMVFDVAFALDGETMLLAPFAAPVELHSVRDGDRLLALDHGGATAVAVALSPCGDAAITLTSDGVVRSWSMMTGECLFALEPDATARSVCYATCGRERVIAIGIRIGGLKFRCLDTGRLLREVRGHADAIRSLVGVTSAAL